MRVLESNQLEVCQWYIFLLFLFVLSFDFDADLILCRSPKASSSTPKGIYGRPASCHLWDFRNLLIGVQAARLHITHIYVRLPGGKCMGHAFSFLLICGDLSSFQQLGLQIAIAKLYNWLRCKLIYMEILFSRSSMENALTLMFTEKVLVKTIN